jgi:hypothetical protein
MRILGFILLFIVIVANLVSFTQKPLYMNIMNKFAVTRLCTGGYRRRGRVGQLSK